MTDSGPTTLHPYTSTGPVSASGSLSLTLDQIKEMIESSYSFYAKYFLYSALDCMVALPYHVFLFTFHPTSWCIDVGASNDVTSIKYTFLRPLL